MPLARLAQCFAELAAAARSDTALGAALGDAARELGYRNHALVNNDYFNGGPRAFGLITYPDIFQDFFIGRRLYLHDPVLCECRRTGLPFTWEEAYRRANLTSLQNAIVEAASKEGLEGGYAVPVNVPGEPGFCCTFSDRGGKPMSFARRQCAWLVGSYAIDAARRLRGLPLPVEPTPHLSTRELDCLYWIARGKSNTVIASILGIGLATVKTYVAALLIKFDCASRSQLPARAIRLGLIGFEDAIPPTG